MVILDTTVWIDIVNGVRNIHTAWFQERLGVEPIGLTDLILCEVLQGADQNDDFEKAYLRLTRFRIFATGGADLSVKAAQNYRYLRVRGITVRKTIDCLIATFCIENEHTLLHHDRDFDHFERELGLRVVKL